MKHTFTAGQVSADVMSQKTGLKAQRCYTGRHVREQVVKADQARISPLHDIQHCCAMWVGTCTHMCMSHVSTFE